VRSIGADDLTNNVTGLARVARALEIPVVLSTINATGGPLADPLFVQLSELFPELTPSTVKTPTPGPTRASSPR
jgi:hypothetical protein